MSKYLEVPIFLIMISVTLEGPVLTNLIMYRTCYINLGFNESECALLDLENKNETVQNLEKTVQPYVKTISTVISTPPSILCAILGLFVGTWSDKFGRKPVMILSVLGQLITHVILIIFCFTTSLSSWFLTITIIPVVLSGGFAVALTVFISYLTDITDENVRGVRMGIFEIAVTIGGLVGTLSSSYIYKSVGYIGIYTISTSCVILAFLFIIYVLEESMEIQNPAEDKFTGFFETKQIVNTFATLLKKREGNDRFLLILCVVIISTFFFTSMSGGECIYLFLRLKFGWSLKDYTFFTSFRDVISIIGTFLGIYGLHSFLKIDESVLILVGLISSLNGDLVQGLASTSFHIYFGGVMKIFCGLVTPMLRSLMSKTVKPDEIGKIFFTVIMFENFLQMLGSPLYTFIYNETLRTQPEFFNFFTSGVLTFAITLTLILIILWHKRKEIVDDEADLISENEENST